MNDEGRLHSAPATSTYRRSEGSTEGGESITLDELREELDGLLRREAGLCSLGVPAGFEHHISGAQREVRRLRCGVEPGSNLAHLADRLEGHLETLWLMHAPTAGDLVRAGVDVEEALERVDRAAARIGGKP